MDKNKLIKIDGGNAPDLNKKILREIKSNMGIMNEHLVLLAELTRTKFDSLTEQGFTEAQALELYKHVF